MNWALWYKVGLTLLVTSGCLLNIRDVGKAKTANSGGVVALTTLLQGLIIWGLWALL